MKIKAMIISQFHFKEHDLKMKVTTSCMSRWKGNICIRYRFSREHLYVHSQTYDELKPKLLFSVLLDAVFPKDPLFR